MLPIKEALNKLLQNRVFNLELSYINNSEIDLRISFDYLSFIVFALFTACERSLHTVFYKLKTVNKFKDFIQYTKITLESGKKSLPESPHEHRNEARHEHRMFRFCTNHIKLLVLLLNLRERFDGRKIGSKTGRNPGYLGKNMLFS